MWNEIGRNRSARPRTAASRLRRTALLLCITLLALFAAFPATAENQTATKKVEVVAAKGMVASAHALASQAGVDIMKAGGNAIDAAVSAAFAIGVVEPNASGIGGEGMMVIYRADKKTALAIDYRSAAPATAKFPAAVPATGHAAAAIPGTVAGLISALKQHGTMKLERVLAPAIKLANVSSL
jgi:gamma-glutamyltranspeptidase/glutathione hydrolase